MIATRRRIPFLVAIATAVIFACTTDTLIGPKDVAVLVIEPDSVVMPVGDTILLEGVATDSRGVQYIGEQITWTSSNPSVVTITTDGHLISKAVGTATVTASAGGKSASAQVTVTPPAAIATSADSIGFAAVARGPLPAPQHIVITNGSAGFLTGLATGNPAYTGPDTGWLSLTSSSGTAPDTIVLSVSLDTFPVGTYTATFPVTATKATNTPHPITVTLTLTAGSPSAVVKTAGDSQTTVVKTAVTTAPSVTVKDAFGTAIPNVSVTFTTTAGNGTLTGATTTTNASGIATLGSWTLDSIAKTDTVTATVAALPPVEFTAVATPAAANQIVKTAGDAQAAPVSTALATAPSVTVRDQYGNPVNGVTVTFAVSAPNGSVTGGTPTTNAQGAASVGSWTLGTTAKTDTLTATVSGVASPAVFTATATPDAAATMAKSAGGTTGTVNTNVAPTPAVLVTDQFGNPVSGVLVTFAATASNGTVTGGSISTNAAGIATVGSFKLATLARTDTLIATAGALDTVRFVVTAAPDVPATATKFAGDTQTATAGTAVPVAPAVLVKDQFGNPTPNVTVTFTPVTGSVTGGTPVTNAAGVATVGSWQLGSTAGANSLQAKAGALATQTFTATATAGAAATITRLSPASQSDTIGATLGLDSVKVTDGLGNPVAGVTVTWGIGGPGTLTPAGATNASGIAKATRVLGTTPGTVTDTAIAAGLTGSPVTFTVTTSAGHAASLVKGAGDAQTDTAGATLSTAYTDSVKDRAGNPVAGVTVTWGVAGGGSITPSSITGASGVATATRVLGTTAGTQTATGTVAGLAGSPTSFSATATHGNAKTLTIVAGTNNQAATINTVVSPPPAAKVTDQFGNPVSGVTVTYALGAGGAANGAITGSSPTTDATGIAALGTWTLGSTAKPDTVTATAPGLTGSPLIFVDFANAGTAKTIALAGGNNQTDTVRATLTRLDSVLVTDVGSNPVSGVAVTWAITKGGGSIPPSSVTNSSGVATAPWTLGDTAGTQNATATVSGLTGSPVTFSATAIHGNLAFIAANGGGGQTATVNTTVSQAPSAVVTDAYDNPISGVTITFAVTGGGGSISGTNPLTTDVSGIAAIGSWKLGTVAGTNTLTATATGLAGGGNPASFTATGVAGVGATMVASGGTSNTATVGNTVPTPPQVTVTDAFGNPVQGFGVTFAPSSPASGSVPPGTPLTDATGVAIVPSWTLGSLAKVDTLVATGGGLGPVNFLATATAGPAANLAKSAGDAQTDTIDAKLQAMKVLVTDAGGNPVSGVTVNWVITSGTGTLSPSPSSVTDASGLAADTLALSTTTGAVTVQASSGALTPVTFSATANPGNPTTIAQNGGNGQSATVNTAVATAPSVKVTDRAGNGVPGVGVTFTVAATNGSVTGGSASTAPNGVATVGSWILDSIAANANTLTATAAPGGIAGNPIAFTATGVAGAVSASTSSLVAGTASITACSTSCVVGTTASTITVTKRDQFGNPVSGSSTTFVPTGSSNTLTVTTGSTNASGQLATTLNSTKAEGKTISVSGVAQTAGVTVVHDVVSATASTVAATSPITASSGTSKSSVTITLVDQFLNPISGLQDTIWISGNTGTNVIITQPGLTNVNGQSFGSFSKQTSGATNAFAYINSIALFTTTGAAVTVNAAAPSTVTVTNGGQSARVGTGVGTKPTYTVKDAFGNLVTGQSFTMSVGGGGSVAPTSGTTNASGQVTLTSWTMGDVNGDAANGTMSNTAQLTAGSASGTATDFGFYTFTGDVSPLIGGSRCSSCHTPWTRANTVGQASGCASLPTLVVASSASTSDLYNKLASSSPTCGGAQMPQGGTIFTSAELKKVRAWINNGALNN